MQKNIIQLIPFKVKISLEEISKFYKEWEEERKHTALVSGHLSFLVRAAGTSNTDKYLYEHLLDKDWTVVGWEASGLFLLARPGEITKWFPKEFCRVIDGDILK